MLSERHFFQAVVSSGTANIAAADESAFAGQYTSSCAHGLELMGFIKAGSFFMVHRLVNLLKRCQHHCTVFIADRV